MKKKPESSHPNADAFPPGMSGPSLRALRHEGIRTMAQLTQWSEAALEALHGMGPKGIRMLKEGLAGQGLHLRTGEKT